MPDGSRKTLPVVRPVTRADCANVPRPCPFRECRYNLADMVHTTKSTRGRKATKTAQARLAAEMRKTQSVAEISATLGVSEQRVYVLLRLSEEGERVVDKSKLQSCALDVADDGGLSQPEVAEALGISHQAVAQIERRALKKLRKELLEEGDKEDYVGDTESEEQTPGCRRTEAALILTNQGGRW